MNFSITRLIVILIILTSFGCGKSDPEPQPQPEPPKTPSATSKEITSFVFLKANNPTLAADVSGIIVDKNIKVSIYGVSSKNSLIPTIMHNGKSISSTAITDFNNTVSYTVTAEDGSTGVFSVNVETKDIYMCGNELINNVKTAVYWKNNIKTFLGNKTTPSEAKQLFISGTDVYVVGSDGYWKNGIKTTLVAPAGGSLLTESIFVVNNDVYVSGRIDPKNNSNAPYAVYWKNGVLVPLIAPGKFLSSALSIFVSGTDIYIAVNEQVDQQNGREVTTYFKNNAKITLPNSGNENAWSRYIFINGNDVHLLGLVNGNPVTWKNGVVTKLATGGTDPTSIFSTQNDIYVSGYNGNLFITQAVYWKNGALVVLPIKSNETMAEAHSVFVLGNDVFIGGSVATYDGFHRYRATYWINNQQVTFGDLNTEVKSIIVK